MTKVSRTSVAKAANGRKRKPVSQPRAMPERAKGLRAASAAAVASANAPARPRDDDPVIALSLPAAELNPAMTAYFNKCTEKLGFVPNVLKAYAFDMAKLEAFAAMYNDL